MRFFLFLTFILQAKFVFSKEIQYKDYTYLTIGIQPSLSSSNLNKTEQLGLGYRFYNKRKHFIDGVDIAFSFVKNESDINTYKQFLFPKITFLHNLNNYYKRMYFGLGTGYLKAKLEKTVNKEIGPINIKLREKLECNELITSACFGVILNKSPSLISFFQADIIFPLYSYFIKDRKGEEFITLGMSLNIGF